MINSVRADGVDLRDLGLRALLSLPTPALRALADRVRRKKPQAIAISLLFSFANSRHEQAVAQALRKLGVPLSVSHQILPEFREYERTSTVVVNAYLQPVMQGYLEKLDRRLRGKANPHSTPRTFVMQSSGGITALGSAAREPVRTVLSGPAGGVVGAAAMAQNYMGGPGDEDQGFLAKYGSYAIGKTTSQVRARHSH